MSNPACSKCSMRGKIENGCCVQGNHPDGTGSKTIVQRRNGKIIRRIEACEFLDPETGKCTVEDSKKPHECYSFHCERSYEKGL
jgi:hypothetical protein